MTTDDEASNADLSSLIDSLSKLEIEQLSREDDNGNSASDDLFVTLLLLVDEYEQLTKEMCEDLKNGHLDIAKTNYDNFMASSTFNSRISKFSYDERPQNAQITVSHADDVFTIHSKKEEKGAKTDPIRMFGLMPPFTLRAAQGHFQKAVDRMVELANVKSRLAELEKKIGPVVGDSTATVDSSDAGTVPTVESTKTEATAVAAS